MEDGALALCVYRAGPVACHSTHYDVFLSFPGGSDTARDSLPGRLHAGLAAAGVSLCEPDNSQAVGSSSPLPDAAVRQSKICIPILSQDYPSSDRCLRGLVQMMEGKRSAGQMVLPIFDRVEPSDVRYLNGSYEEVRHSDIEGVQTALFKVSMLHGWKVTDGREEVSKAVVQTVLRCLQPNFQRDVQIAKYNVFLNFRGAETCHGITYRLYTSLVDAGVSVFKDDTDLPIGEEFGSQLISAIARSTIYVTVISPGYASSKWCLHELRKMMECCSESMGHVAFPLFYGVSPADARYQIGSFKDAFRLRERRDDSQEDIMKDKHALRMISDRNGYEFGIARPSMYVEELITKVVRSTLQLLRHRFQLDVPEHLLSIADRGK